MLSTTQKLPDLWFDWYARFLPGAYFAGVILWRSGKLSLIESASTIAAISLAAYFCGHVAQPISTRLFTRFFENQITHQKGYADLKRMAGVDSRDVRLVSKAHSEGVGFLACAIFTAVAAVLYPPAAPLDWGLGVFALAYFIAAAKERGIAVKGKIKKGLMAVPSQEPSLLDVGTLPQTGPEPEPLGESGTR